MQLLIFNAHIRSGPTDYEAIMMAKLFMVVFIKRTFSYAHTFFNDDSKNLCHQCYKYKAQENRETVEILFLIFC